MARKKSFLIADALDGAMELFCRRGYRVSVEKIADHLGLSRSCIYATFGSKQELFVQVLHRYRDEGRAPGLGELAGTVSPRTGLVRVFAEAAAGSVESQARSLYLLIDMAIRLSSHVPEITSLVEGIILDLELRFRDAIARGQAAGEIATDVDAVAVARVLLGYYCGVFVAGRGAEAVLHQVEALLPAPTARARAAIIT